MGKEVCVRHVQTAGLALVQENGNVALIIHVHHVFGLVGDLKPETLSYNTMPCGSKLLIHGFLDVAGGGLEMDGKKT